MSCPVKDIDTNKSRKQSHQKITYIPIHSVNINRGKLLNPKERVRMEPNVLKEITNLIMSVMPYQLR
jgi:hypothetical protein